MTTETLMETLVATPTPENSIQGPATSLPTPWLWPGLATGLGLWLCYFPLGWSWLAWVALVPLLSLVRVEARRWPLFLGAYLAGSAFFWPALQWMRVADIRMYATWAMLAVYCSFYFPAAIALLRLLDRRTRLPLVVSVPLVWVGLEYVRSFLLTGFAWYFLGHSQHAILSLIQIADVAGVYAVSLLIAAVNAWVFEVLVQSSQVRCFLRLAERPTRHLAWQGASLLVLLSATVFYGFWRLDQEDFQPGPRIALLQSNIDQRIRNDAGAGNRASKQKMFDDFTKMSLRAANQIPVPDLIVWPETSFPYPWLEFPSDLNKVSDADRNYGKDLMLVLSDLRQRWQTTQLLGMNATVLGEDGKGTQYNSAVLYHPDGYKGERYDKIHRVPFGEYVPLREWLPFMDRFAPYDFDYSIKAGAKLARFPLGEYHFGVLICYEDTDPFLARSYGVANNDGPAVDFLVNISNDGWFDGTSEHEEHLALSRFRAIETRRALARAVNMGISAVIDSNGRVRKHQRLEDVRDANFWVVHDHHRRVPDLPESTWHKFKQVDGILTATIPIDRRTSLYVRWGDWLPLSCWALIAAALVVPFCRKAGVPA